MGSGSTPWRPWQQNVGTPRDHRKHDVAGSVAASIKIIEAASPLLQVLLANARARLDDCLLPRLSSCFKLAHPIAGSRIMRLLRCLGSVLTCILLSWMSHLAPTVQTRSSSQLSFLCLGSPYFLTRVSCLAVVEAYFVPFSLPNQVMQPGKVLLDP